MPAVQPLRRVITLQFLMAIILPFGIIVLFGFLWIIPQIRMDAGVRQLQLAQAVGMQVEAHLETGAAIVRAAASMSPARRVVHHDYQQHLDSLLGATDTMSSLYSVAPDGSISNVALRKNAQAHSKELISLNLSRNPLFIAISRGKKALWSETFLSVINGGLSVAYGVPGDDTIFVGEVDLAALTTYLKRVSTEKDLLILVIDHSGQVVADNNGSYTAQQLNIGNISLVRSGIASDKPTTGQFDFEGRSMTGSIIQIPAVDWHIIVAKTDASLYRTARDIVLVVLAGLLTALFCGMMTAMLQARKLAGRFADLTNHARDIAQGGTPGEWPSSTISEFNELSDSLQTMAAALSRQEMIVRESEERYRILVNNIPLGISLIDCDYRIVMTNNTQAGMFGHQPEWFTGRHCFEEFEKRDATCDHCPGSISMTSNEAAAVVTEGIRDDGSRFAAYVRTVPLRGTNGECSGFIEVVEDITERKRAEEERLQLEQQLLHAQKLESLGVLAGGIAHDFNNILMAIIGNADLALMKINKESPAVDNLRRIESAAARAADLAKQMLAYSGKGKFLVESLDLNRLLEEMLHMLEVSISKKAVLRLNLHNALPPVEADATQMHQIIMNLVINASEAIGEKSGVIAITTGCMECDRSYLKDVWLDENLQAGRYVYLEVADTGCGMDDMTLAKLFDPFFTTKFTGRGLGMAAVLGIVRGHKGAIKVYSEPEKGTSFKILLPASGRPADLFNDDTRSDEWHGSGTVLLVDDEETIRGIGAEMLKELGFTTITAADGREALELFKESPDIAVVLLDLTMPHMDGEQCFLELRRIKSDVKVLISSGYNEQEVTGKFTGKGLAGFIQKPYTLSVLKDAIRKAQEQGA